MTTKLVKNTKAATVAAPAAPAAPAGKVKTAAKAVSAKPAAPKKIAAKKAESTTIAAAASVDDGTVPGTLGRVGFTAAIRAKVQSDGFAVPEKVVASLVKGFEAVVVETVAAGGEINLPGFGKFTVKLRNARMGRNPQTGEATAIAASYSPAFKPSKVLKDSANTRDASVA